MVAVVKSATVIADLGDGRGDVGFVEGPDRLDGRLGGRPTEAAAP